MGLFDDIQKALARGAAVATLASAACSGPGPLGIDAGTLPTGDGGPPAVIAKQDGGGLEPYDGTLACTGDAGNGPYYGACCTRLHCYRPGGGACADPGHFTGVEAFEPPLPPGSGTCGCGEFQGPFAAPDAGACCYVLGTIGCDGRPLVDGERLVVAPVMERADWA